MAVKFKSYENWKFVCNSSSCKHWSGDKGERCLFKISNTNKYYANDCGNSNVGDNWGAAPNPLGS